MGASDPDAWTLRPLEVSIARAAADRTPADVFLPMELIADTGGGLWGGAGDRWLHVSADGEVLHEFGAALADPSWMVTGVDAISPTMLAVATTWGDGGYFGDLFSYDVTTGTRTLVHHREEAMGDVAALGDTVVFVSYAPRQTTSFTLGSIDLRSGAVTDLVTLPGSGQSAALDMDASGTVYVVTLEGMSIIAPDGEVREAIARAVSVPRVAASPRGSIAWAGAAAGDRSPYATDGGSAEARTIIDDSTACGSDALILHVGGSDTELGVLCGARGLAWLSDDQLAVSIGGEGGATVVEVTPPATG
jgi:hypothetical protein